MPVKIQMLYQHSSLKKFHLLGVWSEFILLLLDRCYPHKSTSTFSLSAASTGKLIGKTLKSNQWLLLLLCDATKPNDLSTTNRGKTPARDDAE